MLHVNTSLIVGNTGPALLGKAILNSSFKAATILASGCPELWNTEGHWSGLDTPRLIPLNAFDSFFSGDCYMTSGTVVDLILHAGSYEQCQFVLEQQLLSRTASGTSASSLSGPSFRFTGCLRDSWGWLRRLKKRHRREHGANDSGIPQWYECPLRKGEYLALLSGNILRSRGNRRGIWDIIEAQANTGHPRSMLHLRDAIVYGNVEAVREMLSRGWPMESRWQLFGLTVWSPLLYIDFSKDANLLASDGLIEAMEEDSPPQIKISNAETHRELYDQYLAYHTNAVREFHRKRLREIRQLLVDHGAKPPTAYLDFRFSSLAAKNTLIAWAWIWFATAYVIVLPLALVYGTANTWTSMTRGQKFVFSYLWSGLAASMGGFPMIFAGGDRRRERLETVIHFLTCAIMFFGNHFAPPYCIVWLNWSPLFACSPAAIVSGELVQSCNNFSFLMPLGLLVLEFASFFLVMPEQLMNRRVSTWRAVVDFPFQLFSK